MKIVKKRLITFAKVLLSLLLLGFVLSQIEIKQLFNTIRDLNLFYLFLAFIFFNLSKILSSIRLNYYFKNLGIYLRELNALRLYYVGMFYNLFLPGGIGGDGYKLYLLQKYFQKGYKDIIKALLLDRLSGLVALIVLAAALWLFSSFRHFYPLTILAIFSLVFAYPIFFYFYIRYFALFLPNIALTTLLGVGVQLLQLLSALMITLSFTTSLPIIDFLTLFLISSVVAVLPLTIGGVGAREFTFLYGLKILHQDPSIGVAFSLIFFTITLLASAFGLLFVHKPLVAKPLKKV